jgi:PAS domain S-box-containing protein
MIEASTKDAKILKLIKQIGFTSVMIVPIIINNKAIGVIQFVSTESKRHFSERDLSMAEELAARASLAIQNAKLYEKAQLMEKQFQALQDANIIGVMWVKMDGTLLSCNDALLNTLGFTREDLKNKSINLRTQTPPEHRMDLKEKIDILEKYGSLQPFEKEYIRKDGTKVPVILGSVLMDPEKKEVLSFVFDITERKKLEQRKDEFIGIASHELRTPLTSVKGYVQILERIIQQMGDDRLNTYVKKTNTYIDKLNSLISELLDVSKIQSGKLQLNPSNFDFDEMIQECVESVQYTIESHKIISTGKTKVTFRGDKHRLEQVVTNLLTNAIKYSPRADKIEINSTVNDTEILVSVSDYGIGVAKKDVPKLFNRFYRADSVAKAFSGLGIGLFISSEIVTRHKGKIWVESKEKKGSTFYFTLPLSKGNGKKTV